MGRGAGHDRGAVYDHSESKTGDQKAVFDLAWSDGVQEGLGQSVAILLNEDAGAIAMANEAGFRCFTSIEAFKRHLSGEVSGEVCLGTDSQGCK